MQIQARHGSRECHGLEKVRSRLQDVDCMEGVEPWSSLPLASLFNPVNALRCHITTCDCGPILTVFAGGTSNCNAWNWARHAMQTDAYRTAIADTQFHRKRFCQQSTAQGSFGASASFSQATLTPHPNQARRRTEN